MARKSLSVVILLVALLMVGSACGDVTRPFAPPTAQLNTLYWSLDITYPAVRLSLGGQYDTLRLAADPHAPNAEPWDTSVEAREILAKSPTRWYSTDSTKVRVTQDGLVTAAAETGTRLVYVIAQRTIGPVTKFDTAVVQVIKTTTLPAVDSFTVRPDSLKSASGSAFVLQPRFFDANRNPITATSPALPVHYQSINTELVRFNNAWNGRGTLLFAYNGGGTSTLVKASTWIYGVAKTDTFTLEVGYPIMTASPPRVDLRLLPDSSLVTYLNSATVNLGPGATIPFANCSGRTAADAQLWGGHPRDGVPVDIIFDNPTDVLESLIPDQNSGTGNIFDIPGDTLASCFTRYRYRRFLKPGRYEYTVQPFGFRGVVIIHDR